MPRRITSEVNVEKSLLDGMDEIGEDVKPDSSAGRRPTAKPDPKKTVTPAYKQGMFVQPLTDMYLMLGGLMALKDATCGTAIAESADSCAQALDELARNNPAMRRALTKLLQTSDWGKVIAAHMPIVMAVAFHHIPSLKPAKEATENDESSPSFDAGQTR